MYTKKERRGVYKKRRVIMEERSVYGKGEEYKWKRRVEMEKEISIIIYIK